MLPKGFTYLNDSRIILSMDYVSSYNFLGRPVAGYEAHRCVLTNEAAQALIALQDDLDQRGEGHHLKIFDAYRPTIAVTDFMNWAKDPEDHRMQSLFYPGISKPDLFKQGYISERSGHSRGSTVDLTLTQVKDPELGFYTDLEMGTPFDFFGEQSHTLANTIPDDAKKNRLFLKALMEKHGFENYKFEWWHFTLKNEPFPDTYFDFPIK